MNAEEYQALIPHFCKARTVQEHHDYLLWCWSITAGFVGQSRGRGDEGPAFCHECSESIRAKRWDKKWFDILNKPQITHAICNPRTTE